MIKRHITYLGSAYPDASDPPRVRGLLALVLRAETRYGKRNEP